MKELYKHSFLLEWKEESIKSIKNRMSDYINWRNKKYYIVEFNSLISNRKPSNALLEKIIASILLI